MTRTVRSPSHGSPRAAFAGAHRIWHAWLDEERLALGDGAPGSAHGRPRVSTRRVGAVARAATPAFGTPSPMQTPSDPPHMTAFAGPNAPASRETVALMAASLELDRAVLQLNDRIAALRRCVDVIKTVAATEPETVRPHTHHSDRAPS